MDYQSYLCSLFMPLSLRPISHSIGAFGIETSNAISSAKSSITAMGRLAFWHQIIDDSIKHEVAIKRHPVAVMLHPYWKESDQMKEMARRVIRAKERWAMDPSFAQLRDLEDYAEDTASTLLLMHLAIANIGRRTFVAVGEGTEQTLFDAVSHLGKSVGICRWIMGIPKSIEKGKETGIPKELLAKHSMSMEQIYQGLNISSLSKCINDMACCALMHYNKAKELFQERKFNHADSLFIHAVWINRLLKRVDSEEITWMNRPDATLPLSMWWRWNRGKMFA